MILLRSLLFNLAFYLWILLFGILSAPILLLPRRYNWAAGRVFVHVTMAMLRGIVGLDYRIRGAEHLPQGAAIVAMKHQSAWDTIMPPLLVPDPAIVLKRELLLLPFYGWWAMRLGIPIDRGGGARTLKNLVARARKALAQNRGIIVFPQGTRTAPGAAHPYQPGLAALYLQTGAPVVPVALNSGLFWPRRSFRRRPGTITIEALPPIPPGLKRAEFQARLETAIEAATRRLEAEESGDKRTLERAENRG